MKVKANFPIAQTTTTVLKEEVKSHLDDHKGKGAILITSMNSLNESNNLSIQRVFDKEISNMQTGKTDF